MGKRSWRVRALLTLVILLGLAGQAAAQAMLSGPQFRERIVAQVKREQPQARVELVGDLDVRVTVPGEEPMIQSFARPYGIYRNEPERLGEIVRTMGASFQPVAVTPAALLVLVRSSASNPPPGPGGPADRGLVRPIAGDLVALVAVDAPDAYKFLRASILRGKLKLDDAAIWARALANTRAAIAIEPRTVRAGQPVEVSTGKGLASSLLADDAFWAAKTVAASGPVVVAAVGRDELYLSPLSDGRAVAALRQGLADVANDPDTLSPRLLVRRNGRWEILP